MGVSSRVHCVIPINNVNLIVIKTDSTDLVLFPARIALPWGYILCIYTSYFCDSISCIITATRINSSAIMHYYFYFISDWCSLYSNYIIKRHEIASEKCTIIFFSRPLISYMGIERSMNRFPLGKHRSIVTPCRRSLTGLIHISIYHHGVNSIVKC